MAQPSLDKRFPELQAQVREFQARYPKLSDDDGFLAWFVRAYLVDQDDDGVNSLTGAPKDKSIDGVVVDENAHRVFVIQGKYRQKPLGKSENRNDVLGFADLGAILLGDNKEFSIFLQSIDPLVGDRAKQARERCLQRSYKLNLYYVTTGSCSAALLTEARNRVRQATKGSAAILVFDGRRVFGVLDDYLDGVAPPVPSVDLPISIGSGYGAAGIVSQFDRKSGIESWVFTANGGDVGDLFKQGGIRIFARNVRGFLGSTDINRAMTTTLERQPEHFLYFNNGVTIVCDDAEKIESKGSSLLRIDNPQIINGQQTTRMLAAEESRAGKANVLVRVIRIPRGSGPGDPFEALVSQIVEATNWQNQIRPSDLMSNDRQQIIIERELRKVGYQYLRKRQTKSEARRAAGVQAQIVLKKEEIAQAVAACELDPVVVRGGKEGLFDSRYYKTVFPNGDPNFYLPRYWLMRNVSSKARGNQERTYAKWVVLHFLWSQLGHELKRNARSFLMFSERPNTYPEARDQLDKLVERSVLAAVKFYRAERRTDGSELDASGFFNSQGRHKQFAQFWVSAQNPHRGPFEKARDAFCDALREVRS